MHSPKPYHLCDTKRRLACVGIKTQQLIAQCYDLYLLEEAALFKKVDAGLWEIYTKLTDDAFTRHAGSRHISGGAHSCFDSHSMHIDAHKQNGYAVREAGRRHMTGESWGYIWRSQDDGKVRSSHRANDDQEFLWNNPPVGGHPGEDFNCRCWAEPMGDSFYASQLLISEVRDNPKGWTNVELSWRYYFGANAAVTLQEIGYLGDVIAHLQDKAIASDGKAGVYRAFNNQIIAKAKEVSQGRFNAHSRRNYNFEPVLYSLRYSTVEANFEGGVTKKKQGGQEYLVINGIIKYVFSDKFEDPLSLVEASQRYLGMTREEAEDFAGEFADTVGTVYDILDTWQTKFNATVMVSENKS